ncbi:hypothetical protein L2E82_34183 [Cichorium intybus]|uniref:Uncharacterized protein n=1 Tax=Cichorium intybus TaxID=13427 RepID=A0ACB9BLR3_CICIN|nr:hypothetical protein L2E82_34183 [Cichorium intybus]
MGACCSKTSTISSTPTPLEVKIKPNLQQLPEKKKEAAVAIVATAKEQDVPKKEALVVKHRKSHEIDRHPDQETRKSMDRRKTPISSPTTDISEPAVVVVNGESGKAVGAAVRTSSCTKEEVDAILIQCGRLSRSSSGVKPAGGETPTRGRRYSGSKRSFDFDMEMASKNDEDEAVVDGDHHRRRQQREHRVSSPSSRRRSRERDPQQQRSGSKERGSGSGNGGGRRVSRSPNRRSESPNPNSIGSNGTVAAGGSSNRPGKMVSVPATDKTNNAGGVEAVAGGVKKIQVKRNAGEAVGSRTAASPRARSPARANLRVLNENQNQQPLTLSRSNSRKAEHSPYRRNPLSEIDTNAAGSEQPISKAQIQKPNVEKTTNHKTTTVVVTKNTVDEAKIAVENLKNNHLVTRTRSSRLSRDLDINPETLLNPNPPSYASLLLEDIQNFHQKIPTVTTTAATTAPPPPAFSLPACVSKACSILEAVADLNSANNSSDRQYKKDNLLESEMVVNDDLTEPSLHKYVTVRRGGDADNDEQESSGSNSFAGSQQMSWMSSSWEPNSADSTSCYTSSRSIGRENEVLKSGEYPRNGIGRGRVGVSGRSAYSLPNNVTAASR